MKRTLLLLITIAVFIGQSKAQLEKWSVETSAVIASQELTNKTEGDYSLKATWTSTSNQDIESEVFNVTEGASFSYSLDVFDNTDAGRVRMVIIWSTGNDYSSVYSVDNSNWQTLEYSGTVPTGATTAMIRLRFYDESGFAANGNSATVYVDNANFRENSGANLISDGGFEMWSAVGTLTLTSPNGGETYNAGQIVSIQWTSSGVDKVNVEVYTDEMKWEVIITDITSQDGANSIPFTIPPNAWDWDGYKLKVVDAANSAVNDDSDGSFTIIGHDVELFWEDFGSGDLANFEAISVRGTETWAYGIFSGTTFAAIDGGGNTNEDWLISPAFNLDQSSDETIEFSTAVDSYEDNLVVKYSTDYDGMGNPAGATWTEFTSYELSGGSWEWKESVVDISMLSGDVYVAFIYTSSAAIDNKWEVTGIYVSGIDVPTVIEGVKSGKVKVLPNPFTNELNFEAEGVHAVAFYNAVGQLVKEVPVSSKHVVTTDLAKGIYILQIQFEDGSVSNQKVLKK